MKFLLSAFCLAFFFSCLPLYSQGPCIHNYSPAPNVYTWTEYFDGSPKPTLSAGDDAVIDEGDTVYLWATASVPALQLLKIDGTLIFDNCDSISIKAASILVQNNGVFKIGEPTASYTETAEVILTNETDPPTPLHMDTTYGITDATITGALEDRGFVICHGGSVLFYGKSRGESWVRLDANAEDGHTSITLDSSPDWRAQEQIVLASTDFDQDQAELRTLQTAVVGGAATLSTALDHDHWGTEENFDPVGSNADWDIDERGEVALLSRNIVVYGEKEIRTENSIDYEEWGHIFLHGGENLEDKPVFQARWVEFRDLGVEGVKGRYPIHFHRLFKMTDTNSHLRYCSIWNSVNRGIVIHMTKGIQLTGNVLYNIVGRGIYFQEWYNDGNDIEQNCKIVDNLGLVITQGTVGVNFTPEVEQSVFYINNPRNLFTGNVAAGSEDYGFYIEPVLLDTFGWTWPKTTASGDEWKFENNRIHSCGQKGIYQDPEVDMNGGSQTITNTQVYKCREQGIWMRTKDKIIMDGGWIADCRAGIYPATSGLRGQGEGHIIMRDILFVGESGNLGEPDTTTFPWETTRSLPQPAAYWEPSDEMEWNVLCGIEMYDGFNEVENCRFAEFKDLDLPSTYGYRFSGGITQVSQYADWAIDPRDTVRTLSFGNNVDRKAYFRDPSLGGTPVPHNSLNNQIAHNVIFDEDDSLEYNGGSAGYIMPYTRFLVEDSPGSTAVARNTNLNGYAMLDTSVNYAQVSVKVDDVTVPVTGQPCKMRVVRMFDHPTTGDPTEEGSYPFTCHTVGDCGPPPDSEKNEFPFNLGTEAPTGSTRHYYKMSWPDVTQSSEWPTELTIQYRFAEADGHIIYLEIPYDGPDLFAGDVTYDSGTNMPEVTDLDALLATSLDHAWAHEDANDRVILKLTSERFDGQPLYPNGTEVIAEIN